MPPFRVIGDVDLIKVVESAMESNERNREQKKVEGKEEKEEKKKVEGKEEKEEKIEIGEKEEKEEKDKKKKSTWTMNIRRTKSLKPCYFFNMGKCRFGAKCFFLHKVQEVINPTGHKSGFQSYDDDEDDDNEEEEEEKEEGLEVCKKRDVTGAKIEGRVPFEAGSKDASEVVARSSEIAESENGQAGYKDTPLPEKIQDNPGSKVGINILMCFMCGLVCFP